MIAENLIQYLQHPEKLQRVSYQELKTLALEYPYCPHVHQLLALKSRLAGHKDYPASLSRAAAHSIDRNFLRRRMQALGAALQQEHIHEDFFELKPLAELEERLAGAQEPLQTAMPEAKVPPAQKASMPSTDNVMMEIPQDTAGLAPEMPLAAAPSAISNPVPEPVSSSEQELSNTISTLPEPMDKTIFRTWKRRHTLQLHQSVPISVLPQEKTEQSNEISDAQVSEPEYNLPDLRYMAEQSVEEKEEVASESLAALLARQGHIGKAIEMYERLCLIFPEKSTYFAAQIQNLKK